jgi:hypothetical protein
MRIGRKQVREREREKCGGPRLAPSAQGLSKLPFSVGTAELLEGQ